MNAITLPVADMRHPPIIAMAPNAWSSPWRNRQHLLTRLAARGWPVIYSDGLLQSWELAGSVRQGVALKGQVQCADRGVKVLRQGLLPFRWAKAPFLDRVAIGLHARQLLRLGPRDRVDLLMLFHPTFWPYVRALRPRHVVYFMYDSLHRELRQNPRMAAEWRALVARADLLIAVSEGVAGELPEGHRSRVRILNNGVDSERIVGLASRPCPDSLAAIPRPRIGYSGVINAKLDFALIRDLANRQKHWHWVLVGLEHKFSALGRPGWAIQAEALEDCRALPNVHFLGPLPYPDFLSCLHYMDVNVSCTRSDDGWWRQAYPLKFHEYLASGRPVVATPIPSLARFHNVAAFASSPGEWMNALAHAIESGGVGTVQTRRDVAAANDWNHRTDSLENWLEDILSGEAGTS